ncbi:hypothetical protein NVP1033O_19 [Vibrio phage 1.033.O._10N.222.49.B8]|nr:hypothetical protein NVP1033O_19 [Vibrio phage 1.033.O._10N.222.49.B8]
MPRVPYANRRHKAYRALLTAAIRRGSVPPIERDEDGAEYGLRARDVEPYLPQYDWKQVKYLLNCLVDEGRAVKTVGSRGIRVKYWPLGALRLVKKQEEMRNGYKPTSKE